jgi:hypothetical protein
MADQQHIQARVGDVVDARGIPGRSTRRGEIVELLGEPGHEHYRVRWDESHESIIYPADGVMVHRAAHRGSHKGAT